MRRTNIFWATLPMTLCFIIVISVNIYVIKVILAQKSSVAPTVTLPPAPSTDQLELEAGQGEGRTIQKIQRMDEDPSMFYKADMQAMCDTLYLYVKLLYVGVLKSFLDQKLRNLFAKINVMNHNCFSTLRSVRALQTYVCKCRLLIGWRAHQADNRGC